MDISLYEAVKDNNVFKLKSLLRRGGNANMWLEDVARISGTSLLHVCCEKGRYECAKVLLEYGAQVDIQGSWGQTPLMLCIITEYFDIAELLLNQNQSIVDQQDSNGNTPLHIAISHDSVEAAQLLLRYNANVNIMNSNGLTSMMKICCTKEAEQMPEIVKLLLKAGADIHAKDFKSRKTALQFAVCSKNIATVELLLAAGADVNTMDTGGRTPLANIIWENIRNYEMTQQINIDVMTIIHMLVMAGTNLNTNSYEHSNPLVLAVLFKCPPLVTYLLQYGASQHGNFFGGITPLLHAVNKKDIETVKALLDWSCDMYLKARMFKQNYEIQYDCFELAVHLNCPEIALLFARVGYNVSKLDYLTNWTHDPPACFLNRFDILQELRLSVLEPPRLLDVAVICIRKALCNNINKNANQLPLPKLLIEYVKLRGILS